MWYCKFDAYFLFFSIVPKSQFSEHIFIAEESEHFVKCKLCKKKYHEICVLYHRLSGTTFTCKTCQARETLDFVA